MEEFKQPCRLLWWVKRGNNKLFLIKISFRDTADVNYVLTPQYHQQSIEYKRPKSSQVNIHNIPNPIKMPFKADNKEPKSITNPNYPVFILNRTKSICTSIISKNPNQKTTHPPGYDFQ